MLAKQICRGVSKKATQSLFVRGLSTYKTSTGLVGIPVDIRGRENLIKMSSKVLDSVKVTPRDFNAFDNAMMCSSCSSIPLLIYFLHQNAITFNATVIFATVLVSFLTFLSSFVTTTPPPPEACIFQLMLYFVLFVSFIYMYM